MYKFSCSLLMYNYSSKYPKILSVDWHTDFQEEKGASTRLNPRLQGSDVQNVYTISKNSLIKAGQCQQLRERPTASKARLPLFQHLATPMQYSIQTYNSPSLCQVSASTRSFLWYYLEITTTIVYEKCYLCRTADIGWVYEVLEALSPLALLQFSQWTTLSRYRDGISIVKIDSIGGPECLQKRVNDTSAEEIYCTLKRGMSIAIMIGIQYNESLVVKYSGGERPGIAEMLRLIRDF